MTNLELQIADWHERKFGSKDIDAPATYRKLLEEVGELGEAIMRRDANSIREEAGDCAMLLTHIVRGLCPTSPSLQNAIALSLDKCETRMSKTGKMRP